jgi:hypothetical protein
LKSHDLGEIAHFLTSKQGIFRWTDLLSSFKEGDAKGFPEIRTGDLQIQKLAHYPWTTESLLKSEKF